MMLSELEYYKKVATNAVCLVNKIYFDRYQAEPSYTSEDDIDRMADEDTGLALDLSVFEVTDFTCDVDNPYDDYCKREESE